MEVEILEAVEVVVAVVNGARTVKSPDGEPDEIRLVAVRVKVDVLVTVVMHGGIVLVGGEFVRVAADETKHEHAEETTSDLNGESPSISVEIRDNTIWPSCGGRSHGTTVRALVAFVEARNDWCCSGRAELDHHSGFKESRIFPRGGKLSNWGSEIFKKRDTSRCE